MTFEVVADEPITTQEGLGIYLSRSVRHLHTYFARGMPGKQPDGTYDGPACKKWMADNLAPKDLGPGEDGDLRLRKLKAECEKLEEEGRAKKLKNDEMEGKLVNADDAKQWVRAAFSEVRRELNRIPDAVQKVVSPEIRNVVRAEVSAVIDSALRRLSGKKHETLGGDDV